MGQGEKPGEREGGVGKIATVLFEFFGVVPYLHWLPITAFLPSKNAIWAYVPVSPLMTSAASCLDGYFETIYLKKQASSPPERVLVISMVRSGL